VLAQRDDSSHAHGIISRLIAMTTHYFRFAVPRLPAAICRNCAQQKAPVLRTGLDAEGCL